ncbi:MAG: hypothetical protein J0H74_13755 [Chitinophagaceae bacterium]|nr:hypothetical protein [Chitinophagaceae bacterium]
MKNKPKENTGRGVELTLQILEDLRSRGFRYVRVDAFTHDNRPDYMEPHYFVLEPIIDIPDDINKKGIYEPVNSKLLAEWASLPHEGVKVYVSMK